MSWLKFSVWLATAALLAGLSSRMARSQEPPPDRDAAWDGPPGPGPDHQVARPDDEQRAGPPRSREDGPPGPPDMRGGLGDVWRTRGRSIRAAAVAAWRPPTRTAIAWRVWSSGAAGNGWRTGDAWWAGDDDGRDMRGGPGGNRPRPPQSSRGDFRRQGPPPHEEFGPPGPPEMGGEPGMHGGPGMHDGRDMRGDPRAIGPGRRSLLAAISADKDRHRMKSLVLQGRRKWVTNRACMVGRGCATAARCVATRRRPAQSRSFSWRVPPTRTATAWRVWSSGAAGNGWRSPS